jgi:hypothetical protein
MGTKMSIPSRKDDILDDAEDMNFSLVAVTVVICSVIQIGNQNISGALDCCW